MQVHDLERLLEDHPFVQGMHLEHVRTLLGCCSNRHFEAGEQIFRGGNESNEFYLIREGNVSLELNIPGNAPLRVESRSGGDILGWSWLVKPYRWHFDARALTAAAVLIVDARCLRDKCDTDHDFGYEILRRFAELMVRDVRSMSLQLIDMYGTRRA